ncbi:methyltransferase [Catenovulum maritimum]|uniref:Ribosomal RNA small subunit methyltransferase C n=1 Tax=Catenovulum maritimum TaxID=1513271 RepID=A0A0J8GLU9_9ALTE|nr:methyltransferase [Catenovulum maritimum]KMT63797.1 hypothetical protein XM47_17755 [Catenovulum maritimum]
MSQLSAPSQLLLKQIPELINEDTLIVDPLLFDDLNAPEFRPTTVWSFKYFDKLPVDNTVTWPEKPAKKFNQAIVFFPKAKEKAKWLIEQLAEMLKPNASIILVGENRSGIKSCQKLLTEQLSHINKLASGKHCLLFQSHLSADIANKDSFYQQSYQVNNKQVITASLPGVFSQKELDKGTELLLQNLPAEIKGKILDFASGCGVIGSYISKHYSVDELTQVDVDALAIESTKKTLELNELVGKTFLSNGLTKISSKYDWIFTNPPFHTGTKIDYHVTEAFIKDSCKHLLPNGKLMLVANRFLKYPQILQTYFNLVEVVAEDNKFKVYCACNR